MPKRERRSYPTNYPTDLTDTQWVEIEPIVTTSSSPKGGCLTEIDLRAVVNALIYKNCAGCQWRMLPADFPPLGAVRYYFDKWKRDGTLVRINDALHKQARTALGRDEEPSVSVLDS